MKYRVLLTCCAALPVALSSIPSAHAQSAPPPNIGDAVRQSAETRRNAPLPSGRTEPVLPRLADPPFTLKDNEKLKVRSIQIAGPQLIAETELRAILAPYE